MAPESSKPEHPPAQADALPPADQPGLLARLFTLLPSLRAQLIVPYALLTVLIAMLGIYIITRLVTSSFRERFVNQLHEASRVTADGIVRQERAHLENLRVMAFTGGVSQAMANSDVGTLQTLLCPLVLNYSIDALTAVDRGGRELVTLAANASAQECIASRQDVDLSQTPLVANILNLPPNATADKFAGLLTLPPEAVYLFSSAPVRDPNAQIVGVLMIGTRLPELLADLQTQAHADIMVLGVEGKLLATTLSEPDEGYAVLDMEPQVVSGLDLSLMRDLRLYERDFQVEYSPLFVQQQKAGAIGVVLPSNYVVAVESTSRSTISLIFTLVTGAVILLGFFLSQNIARPISRLRAISQAVAGGDLEQTSGLHRADEIGELATAFDAMTLRLRERTAEAARLYAETVQRNKELAAINARLQSTQRQLVQSEKLAAIGQLTAGIVHDVRNPLAIIKGLAEIALEDYQLDPKLREHIATIRDSAARANRIVGDLLKFARQSSAEMQFQDLKATVEAALRLTSFLTRQAHVKVVADLPDEPVWVMYDAQQIEQVLINLIQNAIQAMPNRGTLHVNLSQTDAAVAVAVQDTGLGIPPENLNRIFDPFFTTKPPGEGTGLGLSVSYGIVRDHQGEIQVESTVGEGSTFTVLLPVKQVVSDAPPGATEHAEL